MKISKPIDIEDQCTWPTEVLQEFNNHFEMLSENALDQKRVDRLCESDIRYKIDKPDVSYSKEREEILRGVNAILQSHCLIGYHCARLVDFEFEELSVSGIIPLNLDFALSRISRLEGVGILSPYIAEKLRSNNALNDRHGNRLGQICFVLSRNGLKAEKNSEFLSNWGGEALYWAFDDDLEVSPVIRSIGIACVVEVSIPLSILEMHQTVAEILLSKFLASKDASIVDSNRHEGKVRSKIKPESIMKIHKFGEPEFALMTEYQKWRRGI